MRLPKVGVIVPVRNELKFIELCLTTIRAQTYKSYIYVVDDASNDGTSPFLEHRPHLWDKYVRQQEQYGWTGTLDHAAILAFDDGCDAVFVMAADDFLRLDCIEKAVALLHENHFVVVNGQQIGGMEALQVSKTDATLEDFAVWSPMVNYALIRREVWQLVGGYGEPVIPGTSGFLQDWDFWIRVFKSPLRKYAVVKEPVYYFRMHPNQLHHDQAGRVPEFRAALHERYPELRDFLTEDDVERMEAVDEATRRRDA